jgi:very-short-patch-repair endonuclease
MDAQERPFLGQHAVATGLLTAWQLRMRYDRVYRNVYVTDAGALTASGRAAAAWLWCGGDATLVGLSAAALHGTKWIDARSPAELCRPDRRHPPGIVVRTYRLPPDDLCWVEGMRVTTPARTALDIGRIMLVERSVPVLDALLRATALEPADIALLSDQRPGVRGRRRLRSALELVDPGAESPQESRLRMELVLGGLPAPQTQIRFANAEGVVCIRVDMGWPQWRVAVEYDGVQHWDDAKQRAWDLERVAILDAAGWAVIRVSAAMLRHPEAVVERVAMKLRQAGWSG